MVSVEEGAHLLGDISPWTLRSWAYKGLVASHKIGTRLMFDRAEIDRVINESERPRVREGNTVSAVNQ